MKDETLLTITEYRDKFGKSPFTIRNGITRGRFPDAVKIGGKWFIPDRDEITDRRVKSGKFKNWRKKA